jgi:hypothetical protein
MQEIVQYFESRYPEFPESYSATAYNKSGIDCKTDESDQFDIPSELTLPIPLSATYQNLIVNIIDLDVFIRNNFLVYVIRLPLTNHVRYNVYVLPLPIRIDDTDTRFTFIRPERIC